MDFYPLKTNVEPPVQPSWESHRPKHNLFGSALGIMCLGNASIPNVLFDEARSLILNVHSRFNAIAFKIF